MTIDLTIKSRWQEITHELPPDVPRLWQHLDDTRYFSGDGGETWFTVDVNEMRVEKVDPYSNPEREPK